MIQTSHGVSKRKVFSRMNRTWTVDMEDSFDWTAKKDPRGAYLPPSVEMIVEGAFTRVICLVTDWLIPPTPFRICLRCKSYPVAQFFRFAGVARVHFKGSHPYEVDFV